MARLDHSPVTREFQGGLPEAFLAGYHCALGLVQEETTRPPEQKLTIKELEIMLRRQCERQLGLWTQA
ncbi:MAG: hypothetical protein VKM98_02890 [Cyanobacteriota bacterium]|nr:hypothetical protein [Cyanobacteriota bacterium]